ncbi:diguanylate cyclase [Alicyclobacillus tolerans]|uniref:bifunctional diguanylate cyclase/phosphohydrolase n=1 Tax=Alicyclobacillus tolerans TaxID=90970 RepID=UPI001F1DA947|nr:HD domain-containing phosphohydrolase [Alicyclobacillus tolerans]MCF8566394.1 diguanylate cyclase [Alicyclobacillus tolerans]
MSRIQSRRRSLAILYAAALWAGLAAWAIVKYPAFLIPEWVVFYTLAGLLVLVQRFSIPVARQNTFNLETAYLIGFGLIYPVHVIAWAGLAYAVVSSFSYRKKWYAQVINACGFTIGAVVARIVELQMVHVHTLPSIVDLVPIVVFSMVYVAINILSVLIYFVLIKGSEGFGELRNIVAKEFWFIYGITVLIGLLLSIVIKDAGLAGALLFTALILLFAYSYRDYFKMANHFKELAVRDELTGLFNHRWVHSKMDELIDSRQPFALLMMDIDHFKRYNEVWGHVQGDEALKRLAEILLVQRTQNGEVSRYSGEEFAVLLIGYDIHQAEVMAEQYRKAIEEAEFPGAERLPGNRLTVSIGVAQYPELAENKRDLLIKADDALYKGKFTGRNKVSIYMSLLDEMQKELNLGETDQEIIKTIKVFLAILNSKDRYTFAHTERDVRYAEALAKKIGLEEERIRYLRFGAFLHDIGKVEVPLEILTKRGPLTRSEWEIMKNHVIVGERIAQPIASLAPCLPIIRHHHERFDGTGYPDGLKACDIPLEARILTIADSFDAMTTSRPYQRKRSMEEAFQELKFCSGHQFDPALVDPFIEAVQEIGLLADEKEEELA